MAVSLHTLADTRYRTTVKVQVSSTNSSTEILNVSDLGAPSIPDHWLRCNNTALMAFLLPAYPGLMAKRLKYLQNATQKNSLGAI